MQEQRVENRERYKKERRMRKNKEKKEGDNSKIL